jgi:hypothetical protein
MLRTGHTKRAVDRDSDGRRKRKSGILFQEDGSLGFSVSIDVGPELRDAYESFGLG